MYQIFQLGYPVYQKGFPVSQNEYPVSLTGTIFWKTSILLKKWYLVSRMETPVSRMKQPVFWMGYPVFWKGVLFIWLENWAPLSVFWAGIQKSKNMASLIICPCFDIRHKKSRIDSFTVTLINRNFQPYFHSSPIQIFSIFIFIAIQPLMFKRYESRGRLCCG